MNQYEAELAKLRAAETWPFYDTLVIDPSLPQAQQDEGFQTYADLGRIGQVSFFGDKRKRSTVTAAYNNMNIDNLLDYGMYVHSIGVGMWAPSTSTPGEVGPDQDAIESLIFNVDLRHHIGAVLRINQDEKLVTTMDLLPEGTGSSGVSELNAFSGVGSMVTAQVGSPIVTNRFFLPRPMKLTRGTVLSLEVVFSQYARQLLQGMRGPGYYDFVGDDGEPLETPIARRAIMRCSLMVLREALLRDAYPA